MTIQTIDTATDIGLKTGADKYNANFTDSANMASRLAQTSPSDTTAGRGLTTDALGDNGGPIFTVANYQPTEGGFGLGVVVELQYVGGGSVAKGAIVAGNVVNSFTRNNQGVIAAASNMGIEKSYMCVNTGVNVATGNCGLFMRVI